MRCFLDSNILIYPFQPDALGRDVMAQQLLSQRCTDSEWVISSQVLCEFTSVCQRKQLLSPHSVSLALDTYMQLCSEVISTTPDLVQRALVLQQRSRLGWWDALIVQAALDARCDVLYTEDLQAGLCFGKLEVINPFSTAVHERVQALIW